MSSKEFLSELARYGIEIEYSYGRIKLHGGNDTAREHYSLLLTNREIEAALIWHLAQHDSDIMDVIEERRAIRWVENGDDSIRGAIMCNFIDLTA